jgi:hypothetical protein
LRRLRKLNMLVTGKAIRQRSPPLCKPAACTGGAALLPLSAELSQAEISAQIFSSVTSRDARGFGWLARRKLTVLNRLGLRPRRFAPILFCPSQGVPAELKATTPIGKLEEHNIYDQSLDNKFRSPGTV